MEPVFLSFNREYKYCVIHKKDSNVIKIIHIFLFLVIKVCIFATLLNLTNLQYVLYITTVDFYFCYEEIVK